jgi:hypothetical protein
MRNYLSLSPLADLLTDANSGMSTSEAWSDPGKGGRGSATSTDLELAPFALGSQIVDQKPSFPNESDPFWTTHPLTKLKAI